MCNRGDRGADDLQRSTLDHALSVLFCFFLITGD